MAAGPENNPTSTPATMACFRGTPVAFTKKVTPERVTSQITPSGHCMESQLRIMPGMFFHLAGRNIRVLLANPPPEGSLKHRTDQTLCA